MTTDPNRKWLGSKCVLLHRKQANRYICHNFNCEMSEQKFYVKIYFYFSLSTLHSYIFIFYICKCIFDFVMYAVLCLSNFSL